MQAQASLNRLTVISNNKLALNVRPCTLLNHLHTLGNKLDHILRFTELKGSYRKLFVKHETSHWHLWHVFSHPCLNINAGLDKPPLTYAQEIGLNNFR